MTNTIHTFDDSGKAYDACQCRDDIKTGDMLLISERRYDDATGAELKPVTIVALAWAWPIAVTVEFGHLHTIEDDTGAYAEIIRDAKFTIEQVTAAVDTAVKMGATVRPMLLMFLASKQEA